MTDKSFGDPTNRSLVRNPLLSTAVVGLSLEDLAHNAVLLPAAQNSALIGSQDTEQTMQPATDRAHPPDLTDRNTDRTDNKTDDFDVNEYIARLQGSRYVSAPINATLDTNMNEQGLEEINLNEIQEEQSITADIAQNFSQLPAVLPQVASAVFSSLSNMMRAKSREHTPEYFESYDKDVGSPIMEVPLKVQAVGPPMMQEMPLDPPPMREPPQLKEPPLGSTVSTFRMTSKKKTYAQIPGLSNNSTILMQDSVPKQNTDALTYFTPHFNQDIGMALNENNSSIPSDITPKSFHNTSMSSSINMFDAPQAISSDRALNEDSTTRYPPTPSVPETFKTDYQIPFGVEPFNQTNQKVSEQDTTKIEEVPLIIQPSRPVSQIPQVGYGPHMGQGPQIGQGPQVAQGIQTIQGPQTAQGPQVGIVAEMGQGPPIGLMPVPETLKASEYQTPDNPAPIIPPPTMFSNPPRRDSKEVERTILPPSVARRLAGQSKAPTTSKFEANIFVPGPITDENSPMNVPGPTMNSQSGDSKSITDHKTVIPPPMLFTPAYVPDVSYTPQSLGQPSIDQAVSSINQPPLSTSNPPSVDLTSQVLIPPNSPLNQPLPPPPTSINTSNQFFNPPISQPSSLVTQPPPIPTFNPNVGSSSTIIPPQISMLNQNFNPNVNQPPSSIRQAPVIPPLQAFNQPPSSICQSITENEPQKVPEPPKITTGTLNYRMTKKRPQYYSGPIEGIGAISNNAKPVIAPIDNQGTQAQIFTPANLEDSAPTETPTFDLNQANSAVPFDLNQGQNYPSVPFDLNQAQNYSPQGFDISKENYPQIQPDVWDLSRQTTDSYEPPKQESGFGLIGSLKSKLSSLDINKIQNKVTTFFDPAYNDTVKTQEEYPSQGYKEQSNLDLFVVPQFGNDYQQQQSQNYYNPNQYYEQYNQQSYYQNPTFDQIPFVQSGKQAWPQNANYANQYQYQNPPATNQGQISYYQPEDQNFHNDQNVHQFQTEVKNDQNVPELRENNGSELAAAKIGDQKPILTAKDNIFGEQEPDFGKAKEEIIATNIEKSNLEETQNVEGMTKPNIPPIGVPMFSSPAENFFDQPMCNATEQKKVDTVENIGGFQNDEISKPQEVPMFSSPAEGFFDQPTHEIIRAETNIPKETSKACAFENQPKLEVSEADKAFRSLPLQPPETFFDLPKQLTTEAFKSSELKEEEKLQKKNCIKSPEKLPMGISPSGFFVKCLEPDVTTNFFNNPQASQNYARNIFPEDIQEKVKISSLPGEVIESIATSNVIRDIAKELVLVRRASKENVGFVPYKPTEIGACKEMDKDGVVLENPVHIYTENQSFTENGNEIEILHRNTAQNYHEHESDLNICETCREVNESPVGEATNLTQKLIENITSPIQLSNPVEVPLSESKFPVEDMTDITNNVCAEITHITEETIETLQVQSVTELLDDDILENFDKNLNLNSNDLAQSYGWTNPEAQQHFEPNYGFPSDSNTVGFYSTSTLFFDDIPRNASDEIKAEFKSAQDPPVLTRQMSVPTAPPAEDDDNKSDGTGLDVTSIEQDANKDFPIYEDYVIEPSETDDEKVRDRTSEDPTPEFDSFTNRVEKYKQLEDYEVKPFETPAYTVASYFDTGNYAVEAHYQKNQIKTNVTPQYSTLANLIANTESPFASKIETIETRANDITDIDGNKEMLGRETQFPDIIKDTKMCGDGNSKAGLSMFEDIKAENVGDKVGDFGDIEKDNKSETLPDPMDFFGSKSEPKQDEGCNRLASYFASPKKTEQTKPFFELSQGQAHLRKDSNSFLDKSQNDNHYKKDIPIDLMKDLTSIDNYTPNRDQVIKHVNYFTVHYDNPIPKGFNSINREAKETNTKLNSEYIDARVNVNNQNIKVKKAMDSENGKQDSPSQSQNTSPSKQSVTFNVPLEKEKEENQALITTDGRPSGEYVPVKHHWFYRVDCEGRSIWKGFSNVDNNALEDAFNSPTLSEDTLVATDGGRFDVNVVGRLRIPVYWPEKPTNVKRCSWFYKGTTDARYVPYPEDIAIKLEEEYRIGVTQGAWHRRLSLPNNEAVILHTPAVMVHVLQSPNNDAWAGTRQSTMRPRVVRRGHDDSEVEDTEPSGIDHLLLLCHGVGSACDMRFRAVEEVVDDFRATSLQLIQGHYKNAYENGEIGRIEVLPVSWHATLHAGEHGVDKRLATITLDSIPRLRTFTNESVLDILFYTSPVYCQTIIDTVCNEVNRIYNLFKQRNPAFKGGVSLGGHSLGSVILYDLLCHQTPEKPVYPNTHCTKKQVVNYAAPQPNVAYPILQFSPEALYALGSPVAMFECTRGVESLGEDFALPTCRNFFNIFHPYDPIAYRIEPLINPDLKDVTPFLIPHHKGRKRMHLELKETMARVGADIKQKLYESIKATWAGMWRSPPPNTEMLEKVVEEEIEKEVEKEENKVQPPQDLDQSTLAKLGKLNGGRRIDYVLQEAPFEMINEYLFAISSHVGYWESEDTMLLILREIYDSLGVKPDGSVPQQTMTVLREEEAMFDTTDKPSTSHS